MIKQTLEEVRPQDACREVVSPVERIDISDEEDWQEPPVVTFDQHASLHIAKWVLQVFGLGYFLCFLA